MEESSGVRGDDIKRAMNHIWMFIKDFISLMNSHGAEFISQSHWEKFLSVSMQDQLLTLSREELVSLPLSCDFNGHCNDQERSELNAFIQAAASCHLENLDVLSSLPEHCHSDKGVVAESMSEKKLHEVEVMAKRVSEVVENCKADLVVDIGSGKGYLSLELAGHHKVNVLGIDSSQVNTHGAQHRKEKLKTRWSTLVAKADGVHTMEKSSREDRDDSVIDRYIPITQYVTPDMNLSCILAQHATSLCGQMDPGCVRTVIAGLHTCGSLAVTAMKLCLKDARAVALCLVACCYHLMEEGSVDGEECHFPLSGFGKSLGLFLGRNARNLASQSVHRIATSGQMQGEEFYWRALLDVVIQKLELPLPERIAGMRGLNKRNASFFDYSRKAFEKLGFPLDLITPQLISEIEEKYQEERSKMAAFFQLKLALAPAIESLILLDRLMFLHEQPCIENANLVCLFDPVTSPRCYAIIADKRHPD